MSRGGDRTFDKIIHHFEPWVDDKRHKVAIRMSVTKNGSLPPKSQLLTYTETLFINMTLIMVDVFMGNCGDISGQAK